MADIKKELNDIKNAVYGKEVRGSIHDGIKKINDEVENATDLSESAKHQVENIQQQVNQLVVEGDSSVEAAQARVDAEGKSFPTLKARLDEKETQLSSQLADIEESQFRDSMVSHKYLKPAIVWIDDDGKKGVYDRLYPLFKSKGKVFTSALITANVGRRESDLTLEQILEMRDSGVVEFVSHSHYHGQQGKPRPIDATEEELYDDFKKSTDFLKRYGLNHRAYVQPFGQSNAITKKVERNFFNCSFRTEGTRRLNPPPIPFDMYDIERFGLGENINFIKSKMDEAASNNSFLTLVTHIDEFEVTDEKIIEIMDYADSLGMDFITVSEMVNRFGNLAQFGNTMIGANGKIVGNDFTNVITGTKPNDFDANAPITDFEVGKITYIKVTNALAGAYGLPNNGTIEVYRDTEDFYSYQRFVNGRTGDYRNTLFRNWDTSTDSWGRWYSEGAVDTQNTQGYAVNAPLTDFPREKITYIRITNNMASGYGLPTGGIVKVYRNKEETYSYREFIPRFIGNGNPILYSNWSTAESKWLDWYDALGNKFIS